MTVSGLPEAETQQALTVLLKEYRSHLSATESGELVYEFDPAFERRGALTLRERLAAVGAALWTGFTFLFKISIVVTLVVYFVLFVAMLIALIFARRCDDRDDDRGFGFGFADLFWIWGWNPGFGGAPARRRLRGQPQEAVLQERVRLRVRSAARRRSIRSPTKRRSWPRSASATGASAPSIWCS